jgi:hypothetical protein
VDLDVLASGIHKVLNHGIYHLYFFQIDIPGVFLVHNTTYSEHEFQRKLSNDQFGYVHIFYE